MKKEEYKKLTDDVMQAVKKAMAGDDDLREMFESCLEQDFRALPKHKETIRTLQGIYGFLRYCDDTESSRTTFVNNALHDLNECAKNYTEGWFSPRLSRFVGYIPKNKELQRY